MHARSHHAGAKGFVKLAMGGWRVAKRATPEREEGSARDSKLTKNGGKGSLKASARSAASHEDTLGRSIVALQKLSLKPRPGNPRARWCAHTLLARAQVTASSDGGMEARTGYMEEVKKRERGHGLGAPCTHVAAAFVEALTVEAEGAPKQVLTTFMALVAVRHETVTECFERSG